MGLASTADMASAEAHMASLNASLPAPPHPIKNKKRSEATAHEDEAGELPIVDSATHGQYHLSRLPTELQLQIYEHYLDSVPTLVKLEQYHHVYNSQRFWQPALSLVDRRIRNQILPLFYRRCRFHLQGFNEDGDCEVELFLNKTLSYQALHENISIVVIHGFILHSGRWLGEFDLRKFTLNVDRHWKHSMEGEYSGMIADLEGVFLWASKTVGVNDSREPVLRKLLSVMRGRGVFLW